MNHSFHTLDNKSAKSLAELLVDRLNLELIGITDRPTRADEMGRRKWNVMVCDSERDQIFSLKFVYNIFTDEVYLFNGLHRIGSATQLDSDSWNSIQNRKGVANV